MCPNCRRLQVENERLREQLRDLDEDFDGEDFEGDEEEPSRWDSSEDLRLDTDHRYTTGRPGQGPGDGHVADAGAAYRRYSRDVNRGETFGRDIARYV